MCKRGGSVGVNVSRYFSLALLVTSLSVLPVCVCACVCEVCLVRVCVFKDGSIVCVWRGVLQ